ncbi:MAG: DUF2948 family protein [Paracoccaceae bacterium]
MNDDARFEDGVEKPLALRAESVDDLAVMAALLQDAVGQIAEVSWQPKRHRFALLLSRFRWEDSARAKRARRSFERVRSLLVFDSVLAARSDDLGTSDKDTVFVLLDILWKPGDEGAGQLQLVLSGDGVIALECECLDATLTDVARPHRAKSIPDHDG